MKKFQSPIALLVLVFGIVVLWVVINHREQKDVLTVDKVELNGNPHHAIVRSRTAQYTIFCQDIPEISCLQLHVAEKHPFNVAGKVLYISDAPQNVQGGWRIDKEERLD